MSSIDDKPKRLRRKPAAGAQTRPEQRFAGTAIYAGIAIGLVATPSEAPAPSVTTRRASGRTAEEERTRLAEAVERSLKQLEKLRTRLALLPEETQHEIVPLLDAYRQMLGPSRLLRGAERLILEEQLSAEAAVLQEAETLARRLSEAQATGADSEEAAAVQRRAGEVREIGRRLVRNLTRAPFRSFAAIPAGAVLIVEQLRPADAALIDPARVIAVVTDDGGTADHTAIMLRALGIPSVLGVTGVAAAARRGGTAIVDGRLGTVVINPKADTLETARKGVAAHARERQRLARMRRLPAQLASGEPVELQANLELPNELSLIAESGAAGIGLLRTEFLFINADVLPDESTQEAIYREVVEAMGADTTTIRVLDWGGEKQSEALSNAGFTSGGEDLNPALGLRGLRLLLLHQEVLETQLAAILRAARSGPVRILLPMVTNVSEVRAARAILERVAKRMRRRGEALPDPLPPLGVMVETPAAAISAEALAFESDFLAIGSNDLTMYTLAVDRGAADVASLYDPLHPTVLRLIGDTTAAALRLRRPVSICGEMAGNPLLAPLLLGMGLRSFSMNASAVPQVKQAVRAVTLDDCRKLARRAAEAVEPEAVARMITDFAEAH